MNKLAVERDRLREKHDIRRIDKKGLARYQKTQLDSIDRQVAGLENRSLQQKIFNTFR